MKKTMLLFCVLVLFGIIFVESTKATVSSCTATVSPTSVTNYSSNSFTFSIENTDATDFRWIKITRPSSLFTITGSGVGGWSLSTSESEITLTNGNLSSGATQNVTASVNVPGGSTAESVDWTVQVSDSADGSDSFSCTGTLGTEITSGGTDTFNPVISNITVSSVTDSSVEISWTTDESASSNINYGTTTSYGSTSTNSSLTTSHSVTLESLSSDTTYHFQVYSADAAGNTAYSSDSTFNTSSEQTTVTNTVTETVTETKTVTETVTELVEDTEKPLITFTTSFDEPFSGTPEIAGKVTDNAGVASIEYSIDNGENWLPVSNTTGIRSKTVNFSFSLFGLLDGDYELKVRATDLSGNVGTSDTKPLVFDRLPPRVGGVLYSLGSEVLTPNKKGEIVTLSEVKQKITLSAVGGPNSVKILATQDSRQDSNDKEFSLVENKTTGLWTGDISFDTPGRYQLVVTSIDGAGNTTKNEIGTVQVLEPGRIISYSDEDDLSEYQIIVYYHESATGRFVKWDAQAYGLNNPIKVSPNGNYNIILPAGKYYLEVVRGDFKIDTQIFDLDKTMPINSVFRLNELKVFQWGPFDLVLPRIFQDQLIVDISEQESQTMENPLLGEELPEFELKNGEGTYDQFFFRGKPTILTFVNTWLPTVSEQMSILEDFSDDLAINSAVIVPQEPAARVDVYQKVGGYDTLMLADPDGEFYSNFDFSSLPTTILVDKSGVVRKVISGVATQDEITQEIFEY